MPQTHRSIAFSGKKKKEQLKARRERKILIKNREVPEHQQSNYQSRSESSEAVSVTLSQDESAEEHVNYFEDTQVINQQPRARGNVNRYNLKFRRETPEEVEKRKALHYSEIDLIPEYELEATTDQFYPPGLSYPKRPPWKKNVTKHELDRSENRHYRLFCEQLNKDFAGAELSLYELNLETWRQLWRVTEMSDVLLIIVDARFSVAQFPPYLYEHLVEQENKGIILILNKCDLLPPAVIVAWEEYFHNKFPRLLIVPFSSVEGYAFRKGTLKISAEGSLRLVDACQKLVEDSVDLNPWRRKIEEEKEMESEVSQECKATEGMTVMPQSTSPEVHQRFKDGVLTIGTIGHPNVGKSSLINALMGKKVVSVSKTPGHTKHFQTIFLTKNVKLCDCPGLVFPSTISLPLQVMQGSYPISQVRDPINVVHYISSRLDIPRLLKLSNMELQDSRWTAYYICEAWAIKRGYHTRVRGGLDVSRAANELLRMCHNGQKSLVLYFRPPGYCQTKEKFESHPRVEDIKLIQGIHAQTMEPVPHETKLDEEVEDEEDIVEDMEKTESEEEEECESESEEMNRTSVVNKFAVLGEDD
ncbi:hypothetical protein OTU49_010981 [Cherax quadricarinatus]|uniref:Guanine nucleotide-binding protein-like 1 n=1 Tax=Cherax quadricarinatus TaxID=27406 RepID=A0AAW0W7P7_CHEQU|nr:guanine nucleotide-binding protein-like 1 [Cherax quadricarinatus]XP_053655524.1 guanine nucleotide-binding protein-like 1 [Cherax quadricarinatus]